MSGTGAAIYNDVKVYGPGQKIISGSFVYNGTIITSVRGKGFTVVRANAGTFTVTLGTNYKSVLAKMAGVSGGGGPVKWEAQCGDLTNNSTITVYTYDGTTASGSARSPADPGTTDRIEFLFMLSTSQLDA